MSASTEHKAISRVDWVHWAGSLAMFIIGYVHLESWPPRLGLCAAYLVVGYSVGWLVGGYRARLTQVDLLRAALTDAAGRQEHA